MLSLKILITGLVSITWHPIPSQPAEVDGIASQIALLRRESSGSTNESNPLIRVRLVEELLKPGSAASVRLQAGSNEVFVVEVKRSLLSAQVLAAAFAARPHLAGRRSEHPNANVVVYIPDKFSPRILPPSDQLMFENLVTQLKGHPPGDFIEVIGH
jgi:hypothetical protein